MKVFKISVYTYNIIINTEFKTSQHVITHNAKYDNDNNIIIFNPKTSQTNHRVHQE